MGNKQLPEQIAPQTPYYGYAKNGKPIPRRTTHAADPGHRVGHHPGLHPDDMPYQTVDLPKPKRNASAYTTQTPTHLHHPHQAPTLTVDELFELEEEDEWPQRLPNSILRYDQLPAGTYTQGNTRLHVYHEPPPAKPTPKHPPQTQRQQERTTEGRQQSGFHPHWLVFVGLTMLLMVMGWVVLTVVANWYQVTQDDWKYGRPRTFQIDAVVGHNDSSANPSHFIAINLNHRIEVIEQPGGDGSKARIYLVLTLLGDGEDLTPVTVSFKDVTGNGKPDMLVHIEGQTVVYLNDGTQFRPARPTDHISL